MKGERKGERRFFRWFTRVLLTITFANADVSKPLSEVFLVIVLLIFAVSLYVYRKE